MGGGTQQTTSSTTSNSPQVTALTNNLADRLQSQLAQGSQVYGNPLYTGLSSTTTGGVNAIAGAANNNGYSNGIRSTIDEFGQIAAGNRMGMNDPGYASLRQNAIDDTLAATNASFNAGGRFAGGANVNAANRGVSNTIANLDYQNYQNDNARQLAAANALPNLFAASLAPGQAQVAAGSILDADALARRTAEANLFDAQANRGWNDLARTSSILNGTAGAAGQTTTNTQPAPNPFQTLLGGALGLASFL